VEKMAAYDAQDDMLKVKSTQKKFRDSFAGSSLDTEKWDVVAVTGAQMSVTVSGGNLTFGSGTTANAETQIISKERFTVPFRISYGLTLSQRIANATFIVEAVSIDPNTGKVDNKNIVGMVHDGTTATSIKYRVANGGTAPVDTSNTFPTTAAGGVYEIEPFADEAWFHGGTIDSNVARANSYRRHSNIPDPNQYYKIRIRWLNGGTAPASNTNAVMAFIACQDYAELTAEITAGRGQSTAGQAIGVQVVGGNLTSPQAIGGQYAHDTATANNPVTIGARAINVAPTAVSTTGDVTNLYATMVGALISKPYAIPEADWQYACAAPVTVTTDQAVKAAGAAGVRNYMTNIQYMNTNATATEVVVKDGSTVIWRGYAPASMTTLIDVQFPTPLKGTAATAMNFACITTGANVYINAQGYIAP
jgi:hypothetical protein